MSVRFTVEYSASWFSIAYTPIWLRMLSSGEKTISLICIILACGAEQWSYGISLQNVGHLVHMWWTRKPMTSITIFIGKWTSLILTISRLQRICVFVQSMHTRCLTTPHNVSQYTYVKYKYVLYCRAYVLELTWCHFIWYGKGI